MCVCVCVFSLLSFTALSPSDPEMSHSLMELPILNFKGKQTAAFSKPNLQPPSRNDLRHLLSQLPHGKV